MDTSTATRPTAPDWAEDVALATEDRPLVIDLGPGSVNDSTYGIRLRSVTLHRMIGRGIHNHLSMHSLQVWDNTQRPCTCEGRPEAYHGPRHGMHADDHTDVRYHFTWSPKATVISAHRLPGDDQPKGECLFNGAYVDLRLTGFSLGIFRVESRSLDNPHLTRVRDA